MTYFAIFQARTSVPDTPTHCTSIRLQNTYATFRKLILLPPRKLRFCLRLFVLLYNQNYFFLNCE